MDSSHFMNIPGSRHLVYLSLSSSNPILYEILEGKKIQNCRRHPPKTLCCQKEKPKIMGSFSHCALNWKQVMILLQRAFTIIPFKHDSHSE